MKVFVSILFSLLSIVAYAADTIHVSGVVTDAKEPLPFANVMINGTETGTITDIDGKYEIDVPKGAELEFSYAGYENKKVKINAKSGNVINITLEVQENPVMYNFRHHLGYDANSFIFMHITGDSHHFRHISNKFEFLPTAETFVTPNNDYVWCLSGQLIRDITLGNTVSILPTEGIDYDILSLKTNHVVSLCEFTTIDHFFVSPINYYFSSSQDKRRTGGMIEYGKHNDFKSSVEFFHDNVIKKKNRWDVETKTNMAFGHRDSYNLMGKDTENEFEVYGHNVFTVSEKLSVSKEGFRINGIGDYSTKNSNQNGFDCSTQNINGTLSMYKEIVKRKLDLFATYSFNRFMKDRKSELEIRDDTRDLDNSRHDVSIVFLNEFYRKHIWVNYGIVCSHENLMSLKINNGMEAVNNSLSPSIIVQKEFDEGRLLGGVVANKTTDFDLTFSPYVNFRKYFSYSTGLVWASYNMSTRNPNLKERYADGSIGNYANLRVVGNESLVPEKSQNIDLGLSEQWNRIGLSVDGHFQANRNAIESVLTSTKDTLTFANVGKERIIGCNISFINENILSNWIKKSGRKNKLEFACTYSYMKDTQDNIQFVTCRPHSGKVVVEYAHNFGEGDQVSLILTGIMKGRAKYESVMTKKIETADAYSIYNLELDYEFGKIWKKQGKCFFRFDNLFNYHPNGLDWVTCVDDGISIHAGLSFYVDKDRWH